MKSFSGFVRDDRRELHRTELLDMLDGNTALLDALELAENDFWHHAANIEDSTESGRGIRKELSDFLAAVEIMRSFYNPGGSAKALVEGGSLDDRATAIGCASPGAYKLLGAARVQQMRDLFTGGPGDIWVMAAKAALDAYDVNFKGGRPGDPDKGARTSLVASIAAIAERVGINPLQQNRAGEVMPFERLLQYVFNRVCIEVKPASAIKDLREYRAK